MPPKWQPFLRRCVVLHMGRQFPPDVFCAILVHICNWGSSSLSAGRKYFINSVLVFDVVDRHTSAVSPVSCIPHASSLRMNSGCPPNSARHVAPGCQPGGQSPNYRLLCQTTVDQGLAIQREPKRRGICLKE